MPEQKPSAAITSLAARMKKYVWKAIPLGVFLFIGLSLPSHAEAANRYWVGGTDGANISDTANWASSDPGSCTGGGASVPGSSDIAIFDPDCDNGATIDATFTPLGMDVQSGYTGTITQASGIKVTIGATGYGQSSGTFTGGNNTINFTGPFTMSGGTFTSTSSGLVVSGPWLSEAGGTFNHNSGTVQVTGGQSRNFNVASSITFNNLTLAKTGTARMIMGSYDTFIVNGTFNWSSGNLDATAGTIGTLDAKGNVTVSSSALGASGTSAQTGSTLRLSGSSTQTCTLASGGTVARLFLVNSQATCSITGSTGNFTFESTLVLSGGTLNGGSVGMLLTSTTTSVLIASGTLTSTSSGMIVSGAWTRSGGTFNHNNGTVEFRANSSKVMTNSYPTTFYNLNINQITSSATLTTNTGAIVAHTLTLMSGRFGTGLLDVQGDVIVQSSYDGGDGQLRFIGSTNQVFASTGGTLPTGNWTIAKTGGAVVIGSGALTLNTSGQRLTLTGGTLDLRGNSLTVNNRLMIGTGTTLKLTGEQSTFSYGSIFVSKNSVIHYTDPGGTTALKNIPYQNLVIGSTGTTVFTYPRPILNLSGSLTISGGTLTVTNAQTLALSGTLLKTSAANAGFSAGTGTVRLIGGNQTLSGSTTFYNLTKTVTVAKTLTFAATTTQSITNTLTLSGAASNRLLLRSSQTGTQWKISPTGTRNVIQVDVKDSNNTSGTDIDCTISCTNSNNNTNWDFNTDTTPPSVPTGLSARVMSGTRIELTWTASTDDVAVTGYRIFRGGVEIATSTTNSYTNNGLTPSTAYTYTVTAYDSGENESSASSGATATTTAANIVNVYSCGYLVGIGQTFIAQNNLTSTGTCLTILTDKVTIDLNGYTLTYNDDDPIDVYNESFEIAGAGGAATASGWSLAGASNTIRSTGSLVSPVSTASGSYALKVTVPSADQTIVSTRPITLEPNTTYSLSAIFHNRVDAEITMYVAFSGSSIKAERTTETNRGFMHSYTTFTTGSTPPTYTIVAGMTGASVVAAGAVYIDEIRVQRFKSQGIVAGPLSFNSPDYPDLTRYGTASGSEIKNGTIRQGREGGIFAHGIYIERDSHNFDIHDIDVSVYGVNSHAIYLGSPIYANVYDNVIESKALTIVKRDSFDGAVVWMLHGYGSQLHDNIIRGGPGTGIRILGDSLTKPHRIYNNTVSLKVRYTNSFAMQLYSDVGTQIYNNTIDCNSSDNSCRGIYAGGGGSGATLYGNTITVRELERNQEYNGCTLGGAYGIQIENGYDVEVYDNDVTAYVEDCEGYAMRVNPADDLNRNLYVHDNTFTAVRVGAATEPAASMKFSVMQSGATLRFEDNIAKTDDQWLHMEQGMANVRFIRTTFQTGSNLISPFNPLYTYDWDEPDTAVRNLMFIDNIYTDNGTKNAFRNASIVCDGGLCALAGGGIIDRYSSFDYAWTLEVVAREGLSAANGTTISIENSSGAVVQTGTIGATGSGAFTLSEFRNASGSRIPYNPYLVTASYGGDTQTGSITMTGATTLSFSFGADTTRPTASFTSHSTGAVLTGSVVLTATASDNVAVSGVRLKVDGVNQGAEDTSSPYTFTWDTTGASDGSHVLKAVARDAAGNTGTGMITVTLDNTPPTISATGSSVTSSTATITWTTNQTATSQVEYGTTAGYGSSTTLDSTLATSHSVEITGLSASTLYYYRIRTSDSAGNPRTSSGYTFTTSAAASGTTGGSGGSGGDTTGGSTGGGGGGGGRGGAITRSSSSASSTSSSAEVLRPAASSRPQADANLSMQINGKTVVFYDIPRTAWFATFVEQIISLGIASGYKDAAGNLTGFFGPANPITYAEIAKMAIEASGQTSSTTSVPANLSARNHWAQQYIAQIEQRKFSVYTPLLKIDAHAKRGEVIQTLLEALAIPVGIETSSPYKDLLLSHPQAPAIVTATRLGIIGGDTDVNGKPTGTVRPNDPINRAEVAKIITILLSLPESAKSSVPAAPVEQSSSVAPAGPQYSVIPVALNVRTQPGMEAPKMGSIPRGTVVTVLEIIKDTWAHVRLPDGREGYVVLQQLQAQ